MLGWYLLVDDALKILGHHYYKPKNGEKRSNKIQRELVNFMKFALLQDGIKEF